MADKPRFSIYGQQTVHARAVGRILKTAGWVDIEDQAEADVVIIHHQTNAKELTCPDLDCDPHKNKKRIVFLYTGPDRPYWRLERGPTIFPFLRPPWERNELLAWLEADFDYTRPTPQQCRTALAVFLHPDGAGENVQQVLSKIGRFCEPSKKELFGKIKSTDSFLEFQYYLALFCEDYDVIPHDKQKWLDLCMQHKAYEVARNYRSNLLLVAFEDLRDSLSNPIRRSEDGRRKILLIDDNPEPAQTKLRVLANTFLHGLEILVWKPKVESASEQTASSRDYLTIDTLAGYRSLEKIEGVENADQLKLSLSTLEDLKAKAPCQLTEILFGVQFIVVDQLYKEPGGSGRFLGPAIIRGLTRLLRDLPRDPNDSKGPLPEIIALSRTSSPDRIQNALRSGAKDYALKSRLLALPAVLARAQRTVSDPPESLQRNFRQLYQLPNEVVGLLRTVRIPPIDWRRYDAECQRSPLGSKIRELLLSIPKTDLHIHVGGCMSSEFLVIASLVGLVQEPNLSQSMKSAVQSISQALENGRKICMRADGLSGHVPEGQPEISFTGGLEWIRNIGPEVRNRLKDILDTLKEIENHELYANFRSILHNDLGIGDYLLHEQAIARLDDEENYSNLELALFWLRYSIVKGDETTIGPVDYDTLIRIYLLAMAASIQNATLFWKGENILNSFKHNEHEPSPSASIWWCDLHEFFYGKNCAFSIEGFRSRGWKLDTADDKGLPLPALRCTLPSLDPSLDPFKYTLATGIRGKNLNEYLEGCEFSGSLHLKHPFLIHLYAQHVLRDFVDKGLFYIELRGSPSGYANGKQNFRFSDACATLVEAFNCAQENVLGCYRNSARGPTEADGSEILWLPDMFGPESETYWSLSEIRNIFHEAGGAFRQRYPTKVSLIIVGKRHKTTRQMILEAAASTILHSWGSSMKRPSAKDFADEMRRCEVVGFDLAGKESDFPPGLFTEEFQRLRRLHIPMTVHAGENASSQFVEDAILELGAQRLGHALTLADDRRLMERVREARICVELCPVSNHQTCHFTAEGTPGRRYPLREYMEAGIPVCLNTDNPIISNTDIVKEFFQASFAYGDSGLSLWEALRLIKMGFRHCFLPLPQRRAMMELVDQIIFDLFSEQSVLNMLRELADCQEGGRER